MILDFEVKVCIINLLTIWVLNWKWCIALKNKKFMNKYDMVLDKNYVCKATEKCRKIDCNLGIWHKKKKLFNPFPPK